MPWLRHLALLLAAGCAFGSPTAHAGVLSARADDTESNSDASEPVGTHATSPPFYPSPWMDGSGAWGEAYEKAQDFVRQLTLLEKVNLTTGVGWEGEGCVGNVGTIPRLGFKSLCMQDSPLGVRLADYVSAFPAGGTVAASWDRDLWYRRGFAMGMEHRLKGVDVQLGPVVGPLGRAPEGGRNWEGFSPDPVLSGIAVAATVKGIQDAGVIACTKHYILNEQEHFRQAPEAIGYGYNITESVSSNVDDVTLHELYLWPFADAIRAGTGSIMCSYNQVNNSYSCQNSHLLNGILKGELGFQGFVMSDWQAQHSGVSSALAGLDMTMPGDTLFLTGRSFWGANLTLAVLNGTVPEWRLDDMATRIMAAYFFVGRDKIDVPVNFNSWTQDTFGYEHAAASEDYTQVNWHVDVRAGHGHAIREMAADSIVLLKNSNGALPLTGEEQLTAVFGADADANPYGPNGCPNRGCDNGTLAMGWGSGTANFPYLVTPLTAIQNVVLRNYASVESVTDNWATSQIATLARRASVALVFVDADSGEGFISIDGNEGDRNNLTIWRGGEQLVQNVSALCNNTIVVIHSVGPVLLSSFYDSPNVTAILWAGLPGEQSGNSLVDVLYGAVNPSGKLPFTFGINREDYGADLLYTPNNGNAAPQQDFTEGTLIDYRYFEAKNITPVYPFGHGLSYTTFEYSDLDITVTGAGAYVPTSGLTAPAPTLGNASNSSFEDYVFPTDFHQVPLYIYPWLNGSDAADASDDPSYGADASTYLPPNAQNGSAQARVRGSGAPGGHPALWDVLAEVRFTVTNTGDRGGAEVAQVYLAGPSGEVRVLRGFEKVSLGPGGNTEVVVPLTRRDLSRWDGGVGDWVLVSGSRGVWVGGGLGDLRLSGGVDVGGGS
ncbi:beta-glucosidase [Trichodelitschia bisporula]|uniref:beta-glucosidase n=1 Tax=Trichodelitschia bisporula TaxID=703511 RepID=A0A6G1I5U3_9PEZI|nr:beta-glucosidase [Trichodelitschia bisporula]